ncbi:MAG: MipA/OmpV family protein [Alphaproteobacteria bacterium]|nr:MipA/OmpV family protein [Alphaproteobacteria bacterium]
MPSPTIPLSSGFVLSAPGLAVLAALVAFYPSEGRAQGPGSLDEPPKWFPMITDLELDEMSDRTEPLVAQTPGSAVPFAVPREGEPLWEAGIGAFTTYGPDYPASASYSLNGLPFPFVVYRGDFFRVGEDAAAKIVPFETDRVEASLSLDAAFGADSSDNDLRAGLPDLDPLFEIGPELILRGPRFNFGPRGMGQIELALQGRAVFSVDLGEIEPEYRGLVFEPKLRYRQPGIVGEGSILFASIDPIYATEELHDYFYEVEPQFARAGRPAYQAEGGYLGTTLSAGLGMEITTRLTLFTGAEVGIYAGAANSDSPLFEDEFTAAAFLGFSYALYQSDTRVTRR